MKKEGLLIQGEALGASLEGMLEAELFLKENYLFRRNLLNGKVEFLRLDGSKRAELERSTKLAEGQQAEWKPLTPSALNSIVLQAKREKVCEGGSPRTDIAEYVNSDEVVAFDPIADYLEHLPKWDGQNHVARLFERLPGVDSELMGIFIAVIGWKIKKTNVNN